jgi:hypothetical protein
LASEALRAKDISNPEEKKKIQREKMTTGAHISIKVTTMIKQFFGKKVCVLTRDPSKAAFSYWPISHASWTCNLPAHFS